MVVSETMTAARMHKVGGELKLEKLPTPKPGDMDVLVRVRACGIVPNLGNWPTWFPHMPQPPLPAVFGLDPAGEIVAVGRQVHGLKPGDRVYVNPGRSCGTCRHCRRGDSISCKHYAFQGYFGFSEHAMQTFADYPIGGPRGSSAGVVHGASATLRNALTSAPSSLPSMPQRIW